MLHLVFHAVAGVLALNIVHGGLLRLAFGSGDQVVFGARRRQQVTEPVRVPAHEIECDVGVEIVGRNDIEHRQLQHTVRMIDRHSSSDAGAAVVPNHAELAEAQVFHDLHTVERHGTLGII